MKKFNTITGEALLTKELGEIPFVVDKLLPTGLSLLAGSPKVGKSWLALWLSVQIAKGEPVWDNDTSGGTVLYLCYEDNEIRIQNRLLEITEDAPSNVHFCTEISRLGGELETRITNFMAEHPDTKLIIVDTLQTIRHPTVESSYANDYADLMVLKNLAYENSVAILLVHHFRKAKDGDVFNQITGSTGLQGVADTMFTLTQSKRGERMALLSCIGRDIESREIELERSEDNIWVKLTDSLSELNLRDMNFIFAVQKLMESRREFIGTATELSSLLAAYHDDNFSNKILSKNVKRLSKSLEKVGIHGKTHRTGSARVITLTGVNDDGDGEI